MKLLLTYFWKRLPIGDLISLTSISLAFSKSSQIGPSSSNHLKITDPLFHKKKDRKWKCLFQSKGENEGIPKDKYANAELMKIPNFLHLTPNHIKKHCAALKSEKLPPPPRWKDELRSEMSDCASLCLRENRCSLLCENGMLKSLLLIDSVDECSHCRILHPMAKGFRDSTRTGASFSHRTHNVRLCQRLPKCER